MRLIIRDFGLEKQHVGLDQKGQNRYLIINLYLKFHKQISRL